MQTTENPHAARQKIMQAIADLPDCLSRRLFQTIDAECSHDVFFLEKSAEVRNAASPEGKTYLDHWVKDHQASIQSLLAEKPNPLISLEREVMWSRRDMLRGVGHGALAYGAVRLFVPEQGGWNGPLETATGVNAVIHAGQHSLRIEDQSKILALEKRILASYTELQREQAGAAGWAQGMQERAAEKTPHSR